MLEIYLEELEKSLAQHNISSEQIINEIKEQIKLYEEAGLTEEEIIKRLPSIEELIYQNMQVTADKKQLIELQLDLKSCSDLLIKSSPNPGISYQIDDEDLLPYFEIENIHQKLSGSSDQCTDNMEKHLVPRHWLVRKTQPLLHTFLRRPACQIESPDVSARNPFLHRKECPQTWCHCSCYGHR